MNLLDMVDEDIRREAKLFVEDLKNDKIRKRVLINESPKYPLEKALKSFEAFTSSDTVEQSMVDAYADKK